MRVLVDDYDWPDKWKNDPLAWPHYFGNDYCVEQMPEGPEREVAQTLIDIPGQISDMLQLMAVVNLFTFADGRLLRDGRAWIFTGENVPRKKGDLGITNWNVPIIWCSGKKTGNAFSSGGFQGLNLQELSKPLEKPLRPGEIGKLLKATIQQWARSDVTYARQRIAGCEESIKAAHAARAVAHANHKTRQQIAKVLSQK